MSVDSWFDQKPHLIYFLLAQAITLGAAVISIVTYMVRLETRVETIESGGSAPLNEVKNRITILEGEIKSNTQRIDRITEIMTRELGRTPQQNR